MVMLISIIIITMLTDGFFLLLIDVESLFVPSWFSDRLCKVGSTEENSLELIRTKINL
jgi:hypothetical protein